MRYSPIFVKPPPGVTWQETATHCTITIKTVWWQRLAWSLLLLSGSWLAVRLLSALWTATHDILWVLIFFFIIWPFFLFVPNIILKIVNSTHLTLTRGHVLSMTVGPIDSHPLQVFDLANIRQLYGKRGLETTSSTHYHIEWGTSDKLKNVTTDPMILSYVVGKLRHYLNLPDTPTAGEYVLCREGKCHRKSLGFKGDLVALLIPMIICVGGPYWLNQFFYNDFQKEKNLPQGNQTVMAKVTNKLISSHNHLYWISYTYTTKGSSPKTFTNEDRVTEAFYNRTPRFKDIDVLYYPAYPHKSYIADRWSDVEVETAYQLYLFSIFLLVVGVIIVGGLTINRLYNIWLAYQLNKYGKIIMGEVSATIRRSFKVTPYRGTPYTHTVNDVYYRYLDYEACFEFYTDITPGPIEICYLPHRPHISRPHRYDRMNGLISFVFNYS